MQGEPRPPDAAQTPDLPGPDRGAAGLLDVDEGERLVLGDLINRVLDKGVVISGHVTISVADIDLIALDLRVLITSIQTAIERTGLPASPSSRAVTNADVPVLPPDAQRGA
jgi:gas vesicle structural protein